jgi:hypothetical protein
MDQAPNSNLKLYIEQVKQDELKKCHATAMQQQHCYAFFLCN